MADYAPAQGSALETRKDVGPAPADTVQFWLGQLKLGEKQDESFVKRGRKILKRYRDERGQRDNVTKRLNILWSNVQTLTPALYARTPKPDVSRRFKDKDPVAKLAADILERAISFSLEDHDFDGAMKAAVQDKLLPGRGTTRVRYVPTFGKGLTEVAELEPIDMDIAAASGVSADGSGEQSLPSKFRRTDTGEEVDVDPEAVQANGMGGYAAELPVLDEDGKPIREVTNEQALIEYQFWEDVRFGPARRWHEMPWVAFRSYMTRDQLIERFGDTIGKAVSLDYTPSASSGDTKKGDPPDGFKKAEVWEIWDKGKKQAVWIAPGYKDQPLDTLDDPLGLKDFFPLPQPLTATTTSDKLEPVADYIEYQDQAEELDVLTSRIDRLVRACRLAGVYAGSERSTIQQLIDESAENKLIPVPDWQTFAQSKGGLTGTIQWLPIKDVAAVLMVLYDARDKVKQALYEVTGIADVVRGATSPEETYGAQRLKSQYATLRLSDHQKSVAKFARDNIRLVGEVIAIHFSPEQLSKMTGLPEMPPQPQVQQPPQLDYGIISRAQSGDQQAQAIVAQYQQQIAAYQKTMTDYQAAVQKAQGDFQAAIEALRQQNPCPYRIDIEADSTIAPDEDAEKQARTEFLTAIVQLLDQVVPLVMQQPIFAPLAKEMVSFAVRGFRAGRSMEEVFAQVFDQIEKMPPLKPAQDKDKAGAAGKDPAADMQKNAIEEMKVKGQLALQQQQQAFDQYAERVKLQLKKQEIDQKTADALLNHQRELRKMLFGEQQALLAPTIPVASVA